MLLVTGGAGFIGSHLVLSAISAPRDTPVKPDQTDDAGKLRKRQSLRPDPRHNLLQCDLYDRAVLRQHPPDDQAPAARTITPADCPRLTRTAPTTTARTSSPRSSSR